MPIQNSAPEPQAKIELKFFRGYQGINDKPWRISLGYTPQILIPGVSAEYEETTKGSIGFSYRSLSLREKYIFVEIPESSVQRVDESTYHFSIPRETLTDMPGNYILTSLGIHKGDTRLLSPEVIPARPDDPKPFSKPVPCVYGAPQSPPHPAAPILRARYVGGILKFKDNNPLLDTIASADCNAVAINPLLEHLPWDKEYGWLSERAIDRILLQAGHKHPRYQNIKKHFVDQKWLRQFPVWGELLAHYPWVGAWYWTQNGKLLKAEICADIGENQVSNGSVSGLCKGPWGAYYFHNGRQFSVSIHRNAGQSGERNWHQEFTTLIEGTPVSHQLRYGPVWRNYVSLVDPTRVVGTPPSAQTLTQLLREEAFWINASKNNGSAHVP